MKSRLILCLALILGGVLPGCLSSTQRADTSSGLRIMMDLHASYYPGSRRMEPSTLHLFDAQDHEFYVVLENTSAKPLFLTRENGKILYLYFEITTDDGKTITARQTPPAYSAYVVEESQIDPGQAMVVKVNYYAADPSGLQLLSYPFSFPDRGQSRKVKVRAVLEKEPARDGVGHNVWSGKAFSKPYEVVLKNDSL